MSKLILQTERLTIRTAVESDLPAVYELFSEPEVMKFVGPRRAMTHAESQAWLRGLIERQAGELTRYAVALKSTDELIGFAGIQIIAGVYDFGYYFRRSFWGKGYASEACDAVLHYVEDLLNIRNYEIFIANGNTVSSRMMERLGFARSVSITKDGERGAFYVRHLDEGESLAATPAVLPPAAPRPG